MVIYALTQNNRIYLVDLENTGLTRYQFYGNLDHLKSNKEMYHIVGDEIKLNPNYEQEKLNARAIANLEIIRDKRKPLLQAFDTLEMKRKFIQDGFISQGEFPFIDEVSDERWLEIKQWRNELRNITDGDLINYIFPVTPDEVKQFL